MSNGEDVCPAPVTNKCYRITELIESVSKKAVPAHTKNVILEICCDDQTEEDVEVPFVCVKLR